MGRWAGLFSPPCRPFSLHAVLLFLVYPVAGPWASALPSPARSPTPLPSRLCEPVSRCRALCQLRALTARCVVWVCFCSQAVSRGGGGWTLARSLLCPPASLSCGAAWSRPVPLLPPDRKAHLPCGSGCVCFLSLFPTWCGAWWAPLQRAWGPATYVSRWELRCRASSPVSAGLRPFVLTPLAAPRGGWMAARRALPTGRGQGEGQEGRSWGWSCIQIGAGDEGTQLRFREASGAPWSVGGSGGFPSRSPVFSYPQERSDRRLL